MVLRKFGEFLHKGMVFRGDRPVFWSVSEQRVLGEDEMVPTHEVSDCSVLKLPVSRFGKKGKSIQEMYPDAKVLVFSTDPW